MKFLVKKLNKYNGNICCGLETEAGQYYITECNRFNGTITYSLSTSQVIDICNFSPSYYLITYGTNKIYRYGSGVLALYADIGRRIDLIENGEEKEYFGFDKLTRTLFKFTLPFSLVWEITISSSGNQDDARIQYRSSDKTIMYNDNGRISLVRDEVTYGVVINQINIDGSSSLQNVSYNITNPSVLNFQYQTVSGSYLNQSSSSSS